MSQVSRLLRETKDLIRYVELDVKILPEIVAAYLSGSRIHAVHGNTFGQ